MKKFILLCICFLTVLLGGIPAQSENIFIKFKRINDGYQFSYTKKSEGSYIVNVKIIGAVNLDNTEFTKVISGYSGFLFNANAIVKNQNYYFTTYSTKYILGIPNPKIDTSFVYAFPFTKGAPVLVNSLYDLKERYFGGKTMRKLKTIEFSSDTRDTVCAIRKGKVISIIEDYEMDTTVRKSYTSKVNKVIIEHPDGTLASYSGFKKGAIFVNEGETVLPFMPLGILSYYDSNKKYSLRLGIYYLADNNLFSIDESSSTDKNSIGRYEYITPLYLTNEGVCLLKSGNSYIAEQSEYIKDKELTKKELKELGKKNKDVNDLIPTSKKSSLPIDANHISKKGINLIIDTTYNDIYGNIVPAGLEASTYTVRSMDPQNKHRMIFKTYYISGKINEEYFMIDNYNREEISKPRWYYKDKDTNKYWLMDGLRQTWYENGQPKRKIEFVNGNIKGKVTSYWENGILKRTNVDANGNMMKTKCYDNTGKEVEVYPLATTGKFDNGLTTVNDYMNTHIVYPQKALDESIEGKVELLFNIQPDGVIGNIITYKSDHPLLEAEVKRVLKGMPKWSTGTFDGEPVPFKSSIVYSFKLPK